MPGFIPWSTVDARLRAARSIWMATTRPDGRAHAVPVWFVWDGTGLYFVTGRGTQKARNLVRQPWVVVHAADGDDALIVEGWAEIVTDPEEQRRIDAAYGEKYVDPHGGARATIHNEGDDLYRVWIERVMTWAYGVVATRTDWRCDGHGAGPFRPSGGEG
jgi:PPOX class probable F420-dependent enzyme